MTREDAVVLRGASKTYTYGLLQREQVQVLKNLDMTVPTGIIYGLLGASGCGKTTLLSCIVGLRRLEAERACVLGSSPPQPTPRIGFMPQDVSLPSDFNIRETFHYFGRIFGMCHRDINNRLDSLTTLLDLPPRSKSIENLSGGQKRRVSLATALIHDPELLILDEPTVGLDPVLRQRIWEYLLHVTRSENKTVIISTHYIEEAKQSDKVALMRDGRLLAEAAPLSLIRHFNSDSLEQVFLILCTRQQEGSTSEFQIDLDPDPGPDSVEERAEILLTPEKSKKNSQRGIKLGIAEALLWKCVLNYAKVPSSYTFLEVTTDDTGSTYLLAHSDKLILRSMGLFYFLGTFTQFALFFFTMGLEPTNLAVGIVNRDFPGPLDSCLPIQGCTEEYLSCRFIEQLRGSSMLKLIEYEDFDSALASSRKKSLFGVIHLGANFSAALVTRNVSNAYDITDDTLEQSQVNIALDKTSLPIAEQLKVELYDKFIDFYTRWVTDCGALEKTASLPVQFQTPVYGKNDDIMQDFLYPGFAVCAIMFMGVMIACIPMITEVADGSWERTIASGVSPSAVLAAQVTSQFVMVGMQVLQVHLVSVLLYGSYYDGTPSLFVLILYSQGLYGMSLGIAISIFTNNVTNSSGLTMLFMHITFLICGVSWPIEGMPSWMRALSSIIPMTKATTALRSILRKNATFFHLDILNCLHMTFWWFVALMALSVFILGRREKKK